MTDVPKLAATDLVPFLAGGGVGILGTLLGAVVSDRLARSREKRAAAARQRRAVNAVVGELLDAAAIVNLAGIRRVWWTPRDAFRDRAWVEYNDDLAELLDDDTWHNLRITYETLRSFDATRDEPYRPLRPWEALTWRHRYSWDRWPDADRAAKDCWNSIWLSLDVLRNRYRALARPIDRMRVTYGEPAPIPREAGA